MPSTVFSKEHTKIIKGFLNKFQKASKTDRAKVVKDAARSVMSEMDDLTKDMKRETWKVSCVKAM